MGIVIAALITSGYLKQTSAAQRQDAQEAQVQSLREELKKKDEQISVLEKKVADLTSRHNGVNSKPDPGERSVNLDERVANLAEQKKAQVLALGKSTRGSIAKDAVKEYVFIGNANTPVLFTLQQISGNFDATLDVSDSQGLILLQDQSFIWRKQEISFTPPRDNAYTLRLKGHNNFGDYLVILSLLGASTK